MPLASVARGVQAGKLHAQAYVQQPQVVRSRAIEMQKLKLLSCCERCRCVLGYVPYRTNPRRHERRRLSRPGSPEVVCERHRHGLDSSAHVPRE